jgi:hypothetical protein
MKTLDELEGLAQIDILIHALQHQNIAIIMLGTPTLGWPVRCPRRASRQQRSYARGLKRLRTTHLQVGWDAAGVSDAAVLSGPMESPHPGEVEPVPQGALPSSAALSVHGGDNKLEDEGSERTRRNGENQAV